MEVRSYEAMNMRDAIRNVKRELGEDAVILSIKNKPSTAEGGLKTVEVRATAASSSRGLGGSNAGEWGDEQSLEIFQQLKGMGSKLSSLADVNARREHIESLESSIREMRTLLSDSLRHHDNALIRDLGPELRPLEEQLKINQVQPRIIVDLINSIRPQAEKNRVLAKASLEEAQDYYRAEAIKWLMKRIQIAPRWTFDDASPSFHVFVGAPGAGKTSTLAKLANHFTKKDKKKISILSMDHCRIAASEQLRVLAKVMDVPFHEIDSLESIQEVITKSADSAGYFIDTAGMGLRNSKDIKELRKWSEGPIPFDFHLVLSATEKSDMIERQISMFSGVGIRSLIFTKLDEAPSYGDVLNENTRWAIPLSYFSCGSRIPEDIERATRERIIERIMGI